ncbi:hypothetical protein BN14_05018 [Rhizoctonia solani AG-1 IB]|uniref:Plastocyanin-like domain-containing protein n=1 Tax=Thanatephorus cucumeris (strain AG1-IB / isolate 7/3/14) TaxID=1108050 RepID=M5BUW6_THACB|nr:hypothetical protein BN14_05018 [Rhizoctonia solani AG-1 IB]
MFQTGFAVSLDSDGNLDTGFEVNSTEFVDLVYQPVLHTIAAGGTVNASNVASVVYNETGAVDLIINNLDTAIDHPYHSEGSGSLSLEDAESVSYNTTNPIRRDTHIIPASSWAVLRFEASNPGVWFMHCHIDWHLAEGFAAVVIVQPDAVAQMTIPSANTALDSVGTGRVVDVARASSAVTSRRSSIAGGEGWAGGEAARMSAGSGTQAAFQGLWLAYK